MGGTGAPNRPTPQVGFHVSEPTSAYYRLSYDRATLARHCEFRWNSALIRLAERLRPAGSRTPPRREPDSGISAAGPARLFSAGDVRGRGGAHPAVARRSEVPRAGDRVHRGAALVGGPAVRVAGAAAA